MAKLRSMTGFGHAQESLDGYAVNWEIRSVNGRFLDTKWRLPANFRKQEALFEKKVRSAASRGRLDIALTIQESADTATARLDTAQAAAMLDSLCRFAQSRGDSFTPDYAALLNIPPLWGGEEESADEARQAAVDSCLQAAIADWNLAREHEAEALAADLNARFDRMAAWLEEIEAAAPAIKAARFATVRDRLQEALASVDSALDEQRFLQEIVIMSDKLDVSEEITRLHSHLERLRDLLKKGEDAGRKLDFTLQESFREINTCGNKIQDAAVSRIVVDFKNELEKCREQVQNLE